jgi:hypothetical protein
MARRRAGKQVSLRHDDPPIETTPRADRENVTDQAALR